MKLLVVLENDNNNPIQRIQNTLTDAGLRVLTSFDSRHTRTDATAMPCPHHGTAECSCRIVVMLVYGLEDFPATLLVHGQDNAMTVSLVYPPGLRPSGLFLSQITKALQTNLISNRNDFPSKINPAEI